MSFKVEFEFDPFEMTGVDVPQNRRKEAMDAVAAFVVDQVTEYMDNSTSPVAGHGKFPSLSKDYKKRKQAAGKGGSPNLEFDGDLKQALYVSNASSSSLKLQVRGSKQAAKADGHCNHSGESPLPLRRFVPDEGETFKRPIVRAMKDILAGFAVDDE